MKSDSTPASTSSKNTETEKQFSTPAPPTTPAPPILPTASKTFPFNIYATDKTAESESTAHETSVKTPKSVTTPPHPLPLPIPANAHLRIPFFEDSERPFTNTSKEVVQKRESRLSQAESKTTPFLKKIKGNLSQIEEDQLNNVSWIRQLSTKTWITFLDIVLAGFTLLCFTIAFYFIFHINPTLELKLTPEFRAQIRKLLSTNNFENCNHLSWIKAENSTASIIDDSRCFTEYENGRALFETYKSSTPNSSDGGCNIDRVEIHPCYIFNETIGDPMNIYWGANDTVVNDMVTNVYCNGTVLLDGPFRNLWSFSPPVLKYPMIDTLISQDFMNRIVSPAAFFFQCPKCVLGHRTLPHKTEVRKVLWFEVINIDFSIPRGAQTCNTFWGISCKLDRNYLIKNSRKSFSQQVLPFVIVEDFEDYCI